MKDTDLDAVIESWKSRRGISEHLQLELEAGRLAPGEPVPGCDCLICLTYVVGGDATDAEIALWIAKRLARRSGLKPRERRQLAGRLRSSWSTIGCTLPPAAVLAGHCRGVRAARTVPVSRDALPVEDARRVPILQVVDRLGLGEPVGRWGEPRVLCPLHDDHDPSLRLNVERGVWFCDPCNLGGDGIELWRRVRGVSFADAVRELAA